MNVTNFFKISGDILQFALPTAIGLQEVTSDFRKGNASVGAQRALKILIIIGAQRYGCKLIKWVFPKIRPDGSDNQSFPSGHFMIGMVCAVRTLHRDGPHSLSFLLTLLGTGAIGLGRYLPGKHDVVDLTAGGLLGASLGKGWNVWVG